MQESERDELERTLRARLDELTEPLEKFATPPERGALLGFGKRIGDGTTEAITRITEAGVGSTLELKANRVMRALAKLDEGSYGLCDDCGQPIAKARLKAAPDSVLCITCAAAHRR